MRAMINTPHGPGRVALTDEVPDPTPAPGEVLVEVDAFSLNRGELALLAGRPAGWRPGQDVAGRVLTPAADGSGPMRGTRVVGIVEEAGWAERVAVSTRRLAVLPAAVQAETAATLGIAGRTALRTVTLAGSLFGRRVLVIGAGGGLGRFSTQLAALTAGEVVAVARDPEAAEPLLALGATEVVRDVADAAGLFEVVLDGVGGRSLATAVTKLAPAGSLVLVGASDPQPAELTLLSFVGHENATVHSYFSYAQPETVDRDLATLLDLVDRGRLTPHIGLLAGWQHINDALDALADGRVAGKAVLTVDH